MTHKEATTIAHIFLQGGCIESNDNIWDMVEMFNRSELGFTMEYNDNCIPSTIEVIEAKDAKSK